LVLKSDLLTRVVDNILGFSRLNDRNEPEPDEQLMVEAQWARDLMARAKANDRAQVAERQRVWEAKCESRRIQRQEKAMAKRQNVDQFCAGNPTSEEITTFVKARIAEPKRSRKE
jgi:hypothetical protein